MTAILRGPIARYLRLCALAVGLACVGGCMSQAPPSNAGMAAIRKTMEDMAAVATGKPLREEAKSQRAEAERIEKRKGDRLEAARLHFGAGYLYERMRKPALAVEQYEAAAKAGRGTAYEGNGNFRVGEVAWLGRDDFGRDARKRAIGAYGVATRYAPTTLFGDEENPPQVWLIPADGDGEGWRSGLVPEEGEVEPVQANLRTACLERLDVLHKGESAYRFMRWAVRMAGHLWQAQQWWLAIVLIAVAAKIALTPLTSAQFRSMKALQRIQPLMKELQEKHKGDRQGMAQAQMRLFKEHRVNPLGGCLPLLIQMPILIFIWRAVDMYKYQFSGHGFLWVKSLADPDIWLLILYAVSMYLSMRLTTAPSADPQQQQMQKMMAIMMPFMFFFLFRGLPSAFILYWFVLNVLSTAHQAYILRQPVAVATPTQPPARPKTAKRRRRRKR